MELQENEIYELSDNDLELSIDELCKLAGGVVSGDSCVLGDESFVMPVAFWREFNVVLSADVLLGGVVRADELVSLLGAEWVYNITMRTYLVRNPYWKAYVYIAEDNVRVFPVRIQTADTIGAYLALLKLMRKVGSKCARIRSVAQILRIRVCGIELGKLEQALLSLEPELVYDGELVSFDERGRFRFRARVVSYPYVEDGIASTRGCVLFSVVTKSLRDVFLLLEAMRKIQGGEIKWQEAPLY